MSVDERRLDELIVESRDLQVTAEEAITQAGSIFVVDRQHMALLTYALGEYPIPDTFASTDDSVA